MSGKNTYQRTPIGLLMEMGLYGEVSLTGKAGKWVCGLDLAVDEEDATVVVAVASVADSGEGRFRAICKGDSKFTVVEIRRPGTTPTDAIKALHRAWKAHEAKSDQAVENEAEANDGAEADGDQVPGTQES